MKSLLILSVLVCGSALAHPGATDAKACHKDGKLTHCHAGAKAPAKAPATFRLSDPPPKEEAADPGCLSGPRGARYRIVNGQRKAGC
jgi:hypothetical protein